MRRAGREIVLSPKEIALLEYLLRTPGAPLPRTNFVEEVWRMQGVSLTNVVDMYIYYLRLRLMPVRIDHRSARSAEWATRSAATTCRVRRRSITILTKRSDPGYGEHTRRITNLDNSEPSPLLFQLPPDYEIVDETDRITITYKRP